jgi:hypothetical protein
MINNSAYVEASVRGPSFIASNLDDAFISGMACADQGYKRSSNPHPTNTDLFQWWDSGYCQSMDDLCGDRQ